MAKYIDSNGFAHFLGKLKTLLDGKVNAETGKGLSTNDYTTAEKEKLAGIAAGANAYTHPSYTSKTSGLYKITVDSSGHVSAASAVAASDIPDLSGTYALKTDITSMYRHKGSVSSTSNLPSSGQTAGDVYNVTATGMNYVWTGSDWDALGEVFTIDSMTTTEIDSAFVTAGLVAAA